jgi:hypothetical protein
VPTQTNVAKAEETETKTEKPKAFRTKFQGILFLPEYILSPFAKIFQTTPEEFLDNYKKKLNSVASSNDRIGRFESHLYYEILRLFSKDEGPFTPEQIQQKTPRVSGGFYKDEEIDRAMKLILGIGLVRKTDGSYKRNEIF